MGKGLNDDEILFRVDDACIAFEDAWLANQIPRLDDFLGEFTGAERRVLLEQLIALDIEYRLNRGETPTRAAYTQRYPELSEAPTEADTKNARPPLDPLALVPGDDLGGYVIVREIGRGGMGVVYEAAQRVLSRRVALKVLPGFGLASDIAIARFERETKAIARLHHSNVVPFFEAGSDRGVHFYAMQLIEGRALDDLLRDDVERDGAQLRRMADFIRQAARAIAYAHGRGVMHRDLKPSNLLVDHDQTVWVTDFGLAKLTDEAMTHTGEMIGTLRYMSPERLVGKGDARAEVYALGATLYEAITARPVFTACDNVELMELIRNRDPETPSKLNAAIPLDLETIVVKALEKEPERRYESAAAFADDLERFLDDRPITARRAGPIERTLRWARRNKAMAGLIAAGIVFAIGASIAAIVFQQQSELNDDLRIDATVARDETRLNLYYAEMSLAAREAVASTGFAAMRDITERWLPAPRPNGPSGLGVVPVSFPVDEALPGKAATVAIATTPPGASTANGSRSVPLMSSSSSTPRPTRSWRVRIIPEGIRGRWSSAQMAPVCSPSRRRTPSSGRRRAGPWSPNCHGPSPRSSRPRPGIPTAGVSRSSTNARTFGSGGRLTTS